MKNYIFIFLAVFSLSLSAQNVGINTSGLAPADCAMLDIASTDKGLLVPRVALTAVGTYAPLTGTAVTGLLVYSSAAPTGGNGTGYYYWTGTQWANLIDNVTPGNPWYVGGNIGTTAATAAYGSTINNSWIGTQDNTAFVFGVNNLERMRINPTDGEVVIGSQTSGLPGDLLCAVSNNSVPWAVNGYSTFNGGATYGQITGGSTVFGAVQGEYNGTNASGCGVRGSMLSSVKGNDYTAPTAGVTGNGSYATGNNVYSFGVFGFPGLSGGGALSADRSGGVMGSRSNATVGSLGYRNSASGLFGACFFGATGNSTNTGRLSSGGSNQSKNLVASGFMSTGDLFGGMIKGENYGAYIEGTRFASYFKGNTYTNGHIGVVTDEKSSLVNYATLSNVPKIQLNGKCKLVNGNMEVLIDERFSNLIDLESISILLTPMGQTNGVFVQKYDENGFSIKENNSGSSSVDVSWIFIASLKNYSKEEIPQEILVPDFSSNMNEAVVNDGMFDAKPVWWDASANKLRFDVKPIVIEKISNVDLYKSSIRASDKLPNE